MKTEPESRLIPTNVAFLVAAFVLVTGTLLLMSYGPGNMGRGFAVGGSLALAGFTFALWRAARRPQNASSFERVFTQTGDERDNMVATQAFAVVGVVSIIATSFATVAVAIGAPADIVFVILIYLLLAAAVISFLVALRRN